MPTVYSQKKYVPSPHKSAYGHVTLIGEQSVIMACALQGWWDYGYMVKMPIVVMNDVTELKEKSKHT